MFESPRPLLTAGILAISAFLVSLTAQQPWVRAGMAALADMPAIAFVHRQLSTIPWWAEAVLALFGLIAGIILRRKPRFHRPGGDVPKQAEIAPDPSMPRPLVETQNVLIVAPSIQITATPTVTPAVTPQVNVVLTIQSVVGS